MTSLEPDARQLTDHVNAAFAELIERGEVDVVEGDHPEDLEIQADQWTVAMEGDPPSVAFLAIDDEPTSPDDMRTSLQAVIEPQDLAALRVLDSHLDGALRQALQQSSDLLSLTLATWLAENDDTRHDSPVT